MEAGKAAGKVWLVTGGGSGLGEACGKLFAKSGALVALLDRDAEAGKAAAQSIKCTPTIIIIIDRMGRHLIEYVGSNLLRSCLDDIVLSNFNLGGR
jgi:NAD(P)-dependent dehydrogenase (short-subunit alcohol dehydrogenase family)